MKSFYFSILTGLLCTLFFIPNAVHSQVSLTEKPKLDFALLGGDQPHSFFDLISQTGVPEIELATDLKSLILNKKKDEYQKATIKFSTLDGQLFERDAKIKPRGKSRRKICDFPPIKLKFKKDDLADSGLQSDFNKMKIVTHCFNSNASEEKLLKEYLAYKMYQLLNEYSFNVQLLNINYVDTEHKFKPSTKHAFIIESDDELAARLGAEVLEVYNTQPIQMAPKPYLTLALFQFMIGNTDWRLDVRHNLELMRIKGVEGLVAIPYDFDFSGLVDANYARPTPELQLFNVRERCFMGPCPTEDELREVVELFLSKKEAMLELCNQFDEMHKKERKDARQFIESFYAQLEDVAQRDTIFIKVCHSGPEPTK